MDPNIKKEPEFNFEMVMVEGNGPLREENFKHEGIELKNDETDSLSSESRAEDRNFSFHTLFNKNNSTHGLLDLSRNQEILSNQNMLVDNRSNQEKLIDCVRNYEHLFNPFHKDYRDAKCRKDTWDEIGAHLGVTGDECKDMWTKLRNAYTNARKRRKPMPGQAAKNLTNWKYEEQMSFLIPIIDPRKNHGTVTHSDNEDDSVNCETIEKNPVKENCTQEHLDSSASLSIQSAQDSIISQLPFHEPSPSLQSHRLRHGRRDLMESSMIEMVSTMKENSRIMSESLSRIASGCTQHLNCATDDTEMFFLSLGRTVKKLSHAEQARIKIEFSNAVFNAELHSIGDGNP